MLIGLTGGIACGKTTVAERLRARGAIVIDADQVARDVVAPGTPGLAQVVLAFGPTVLTGEGHLDRARLGATVFGDAAARRRLEGILHPLIAAESVRRIQAAADAPLVVYDAALLIESGRAEMFRPLVVVTADPATQRARLMRRDGLDLAAAEARIAAQMPVAEKVARADYVVMNDGDLAATDAQIEALWRTLTGDPT